MRFNFKGEKHMKKMKREDVYDEVLDIAKDIANKKQGSLFIIGPKENFKGKYELLFPQIVSEHSIAERGMHEILVRLAELDGAFFISDEGELFAIGARIKKSVSMPGFGTRHAAASGITTEVQESTAILISDKIGWIRVFQKGKIVLETDSSKTPPTIMHKVITFLTDKDTAIITAAGASTVIMGSFIPIVVVSGTYLAIKTATGIIKKNFGKDKD